MIRCACCLCEWCQKAKLKAEFSTKNSTLLAPIAIGQPNDQYHPYHHDVCSLYFVLGRMENAQR